MKLLQFTIYALTVISLSVLIGCSGGNNAADALKALGDSLQKAQSEMGSSSVFTAEDGKFKILFPGQPTRSTQPVETEVGSVEQVMYIYEKSVTEAYMVMYSDFPSALIEKGKPEDFIQGGKEGALSSFGAKVTKEEKLSVNNVPGIYVEADNDTMYVVFKAFLKKNRFYQVMMVRDGSAPTTDVVKPFMDSFEITE